MPNSLLIPLSLPYGFLLVLARVAGVFAFVPLPGLRSGPEIARVALALCVTVALFPQWPQLNEDPGMGRLAGWLLAEAGLGTTVGLAVSFITEALVFAAQVIGLQAGYAYASTVDPSTQADSGILLVLAQLAAVLLFFTLGLERELVRIFARSLETNPPGTFVLTRPVAEQILKLGGDMLSTGLRLAMPAVALLVLVDVALALLGRINAQLQLLTLAFPAKMLVALAILGWIAVLLPAVFRAQSGRILAVAARAVGGR